MTAPEPSPAPLAPEIRALAMEILIDRVQEDAKLIRAEFSARYELGTSIKWESPLDGSLLGTVLRTRPEPRWIVVDEKALHAHLSEFDGCVETVTYLAVPGIGWHELDGFDELAVLVREHAPHLLREEQRVTADAVTAAVEQSKATGVAAAPGIVLRRPGGQLRVVPHKGAGAAVDRMVDAGLFRLDGRPVLPAGSDTESEAS